ncbi:52 kDa repressor of the inhibitor of the protein kinase-like [Sipha flava]|uniref:52 kDa repressor of the inhibitor of the protein kinase-like n=1 Tax=Sipha flava TaxID=143950 RepID=A0A8B8FVL4_9HEMI|nr:52 kDa repressor of the inhibitor of the protein kinase-like [Sipha flava]
MEATAPNVEDLALTPKEEIKFYLDSDIQIVIAELRIWQSKLKADNKNPKAAIDALRLCRQSIFPNIHQLLKILCNIPVSTSTPERSFSCMKRLKTYLRNSMTENRLNGLTLLAVHREIPIDAKEVLDVMSQKSKKLDIIL